MKKVNKQKKYEESVDYLETFVKDNLGNLQANDIEGLKAVVQARHSSVVNQRSAKMARLDRVHKQVETIALAKEKDLVPNAKAFKQMLLQLNK